MKLIYKVLLSISALFYLDSSPLSAMMQDEEEKTSSRRSHSALPLEQPRDFSAAELLFNLGCEYMTHNYKKAEECFRVSGTSEAKANLGFMYRDAEAGVKLASQKMRNRIAAQLFEESRHPIALCELGLMYLNGEVGENLSEEQRNLKAEDYLSASKTDLANSLWDHMRECGLIQKTDEAKRPPKKMKKDSKDSKDKMTPQKA